MPGVIRFAWLCQEVFSGALPSRHARHSAYVSGDSPARALPDGRPRVGSYAVNVAWPLRASRATPPAPRPLRSFKAALCAAICAMKVRMTMLAQAFERAQGIA